MLMQRQSAPLLLSFTLLASLLACSDETAPPKESPVELGVLEAELIEPGNAQDDGIDGGVSEDEPKAKPEVEPDEKAEVHAATEGDEHADGDDDDAGAKEGAESHEEKPASEAKADAPKKGDKKKSDGKSGDKAAEEPAKPELPKFSELGINVTKVGQGTAATSASKVTIHYRASLVGAEKPFDSTFLIYRPLEVALDPSAKMSVIEGLRRGLAGLTPGSEVRLEIPANLAWGEKGNPAVGVPANADVVFEVTVLEVQ
jgi:FK506-binding nuclear protein